MNAKVFQKIAKFLHFAIDNPFYPVYILGVRAIDNPF